MSTSRSSLHKFDPPKKQNFIIFFLSRIRHTFVIHVNLVQVTALQTITQGQNLLTMDCLVIKKFIINRRDQFLGNN